MITISNTYKSNSILHLSRAEKAKRQKLEHALKNGKRDQLKPAKNFDSKQSRVFNFIVENAPHLTNTDLPTINMLVLDYTAYLHAMENLNKYGFVDKSRKNPYFQMAMQADKACLSLINTLNLSPKTRGKQIMHDLDNEDFNDPIEDLKNE